MAEALLTSEMDGHNPGPAGYGAGASKDNLCVNVCESIRHTQGAVKPPGDVLCCSEVLVPPQ